MAKVCPECGSSLIIRWDTQIIARKPHKRHRCKKCGRVFVHPRWTGKKKDASAQLIVDASGSWSDKSKWGKSTVKGKNVSKQLSNDTTEVLDTEGEE